MTRLYSWNVNGIRAAARNGLVDWIKGTKPDVLCLQETKAHDEDVPGSISNLPGYSSVWQPANKKGYSGTGTLFRKGREPVTVTPMGVERFDNEGRTQVIEYDELILINAYYPNSQPERRRLDYKLGFCTAMVRLCNKLTRAGKRLAVCGDFNIAHKDIDLARPKENRNNPGFYPEECARMDRFAAAGYVDTFRHFNKEPGHYTWWTYRFNAREKNIGWRLDYFWVNSALLPDVAKASIHADIKGSDHCPVSITLE